MSVFIALSACVFVALSVCVLVALSVSVFVAMCVCVVALSVCVFVAPYVCLCASVLHHSVSLAGTNSAEGVAAVNSSTLAHAPLTRIEQRFYLIQ